MFVCRTTNETGARLTTVCGGLTSPTTIVTGPQGPRSGHQPDQCRTTNPARACAVAVCPQLGSYGCNGRSGLQCPVRPNRRPRRDWATRKRANGGRAEARKPAEPCRR